MIVSVRIPASEKKSNKFPDMITVVLPALNEQETISKVVTFCLQEPGVSEVIVVDDNSTDTTRDLAATAGARVLISKEKGKGVSMKEGIAASSNQYIVFLDADIHPYPQNTIKKLTTPLINDECDFVKGTFARNAGRVTELVAKPLLKIFYPELSGYQQPLSGMIAGKKNYLNKIDFFHDYGVDIGILIDMFLMQARIQEVNIGYIENKSKPWRLLGNMSAEVARAIIKKATGRHRQLVNLEELGSVNEITQQMEKVVKENMNSIRKLFVFDMDDTLLRGRFIDTCAEKFSFADKLSGLRKIENDPAVLTKRIAELLKGIPMGELLQVAASIPLVDDVITVIDQLRKKGNVTGIITDSYQFVADYIKNKVGADFAMGNHLDFFEGCSTGEVTIPSWFYYSMQSKCSHSLCKTNALIHAAHKYDISIENCITVGDSANDRCMIEKSGMGVAFCSNDAILKKVADKIIERKSFRELLDTQELQLKVSELRLAV